MSIPFSTAEEALRWGAISLRKEAILEPELEAEILLAHALAIRREDLLSNLAKPLAQEVEHCYTELIEKRATRYPLQYLTGEQEFWSLSFTVDERALIPRPESEGIIEAVLGRIELDRPLILDIGTGSGNLAVTLAVEVASATICATDVSWGALQVAKHNAVLHTVQERVMFLQGDLLACFRPNPAFDLIVSNPPYIGQGELSILQPEVRDHEPLDALLSGGDGLDCYRRLLPEALRIIKTGGWLIGELPDGKADKVEKLASESGWVVEGIRPDLQGIPRVMVCRNQGNS